MNPSFLSISMTTTVFLRCKIRLYLFTVTHKRKPATPTRQLFKIKKVEGENTLTNAGRSTARNTYASLENFFFLQNCISNDRMVTVQKRLFKLNILDKSISTTIPKHVWFLQKMEQFSLMSVIMFYKIINIHSGLHQSYCP